MSSGLGFLLLILLFVWAVIFLLKQWNDAKYGNRPTEDQRTKEWLDKLPDDHFVSTADTEYHKYRRGGDR